MNEHPDPHSSSPRGPGRGNPLSDLPDRILELLRSSPAGELEHHVKAMVAQAAERMDLVTREEFEVQQALVARLRERIDALEQELANRPNADL